LYVLAHHQAAPNASYVAQILHLNNNNWGESQFTFTDLNSPVTDLKSPVTRIHFVAHTNPSNEPGYPSARPTIHWTLFFTISNNRSVHVEATPNEPGRPGMVIINSGQYNLTDQSADVVSADVLPGQTVESFLGVIVDRGRDNYTFDPTSKGCQYWLSTISKDFVEEGTICSKGVSVVRCCYRCNQDVLAVSFWDAASI